MTVGGGVRGRSCAPGGCDGSRSSAPGRRRRSRRTSPTRQRRPRRRRSERPSDRAVDPSQPDFTLIALPTNLRMPRFGSAFRVTHRFMRPLGNGDFNDLLGDGFGIDGSAQVGLEFRFGIMSGTQIGIHRTSDRTIELFGQHQLARQGERLPVTVDVVGTFEGTNNLRDVYSPAIGAVMSRTLGRHGALYVQPVYVHNSNPAAERRTSTTTARSFSVSAPAFASDRRCTWWAKRRRGSATTPMRAYLSFAVEKRCGRPFVPGQLLERLRHDAGPDRARRLRLRHLVSRLQHFAQVLLIGQRS